MSLVVDGSSASISNVSPSSIFLTVLRTIITGSGQRNPCASKLCVGFSNNGNHYATGHRPFLPAKLTFDFSSDYSGYATLKMRVLGKPDAELEIWQGHHLVGRINGSNVHNYAEIEKKVLLIAGEQPLELRPAYQSRFIIDWLEFTH